MAVQSVDFEQRYGHLFEFATQRQLDYLEAIREHGTQAAAAEHLGVSKQSLEEALQRLRKKAAMRGMSPQHDMHKMVPEGYIVKGVSTYYDEEGKARGQWVKSSLDEQKKREALQEAFAAMAEELPRLKASKPAKGCMQDLLSLYTLTDCHVGALAWSKENLQADWDLKIAEETLTKAFEHMVASSQPAATCVVNQLGDFLHSDGILPVTPTSGHILDQDGRFAKVVATAVRILRRIVDFALQKHEKVIVLLAEGNHDITSSIWLRVMFKALYENEPRVEVIDSMLPYYIYAHGETMLAFHHGHLKKNDALPLLFASQFPQVWGQTTKRYVHVGHRHHHVEIEHSGMKVIQHSTLAARDAYAARGGWLSERQVVAISYSKAHGEVGRHTITPEML